MLDPIGNLTYDYPYTPNYNQQRAFTGIQAENAILNIFPSTFAGPNHFNNMGNGIALNNSDGDLNWCFFTNFAAGPFDEEDAGNGILFESDGFHTLAQTGLGVDDPQASFNNCEVGIKTIARGPQVDIANSSDNRMENMDVGYDILPTEGGSIGLGEFDWSVIQENQINANDDGINFEIIEGGLSQSHLNIINNDIFMQAFAAKGINMVGVNELPQDIHINNNSIINVNDGNIGIWILNIDGLNVQNNILDLGINDFINITHGILISNSQNSFIRCNQIFTDALITNDISSDYRGIIVDTSPGTILNSNTTTNMRTGIRFSGSSIMSQVQCNRMIASSAFSEGLLFTLSGQSGDQTHNRNIWIGTGARNDNPNWPLSLFTRSFTANQFPIGWSPAGWFLSGPPINCQGCGNGGGGGGGNEPNNIDQLDGLIASSGIDIGTYTAGYNWILQHQLYLKLLKYPNLLSNNSQMASFKNNYEQGIGHQLFDIRDQINQLYTVNQADQSTWDNNALQIRSLLDEILEIDALLVDIYNNGGDPTALLFNRKIKYNQVQSLQHQNATIFANYVNNRINAAPTIVASNNVIPTTQEFEINEQRLYTILLNTEVINQPPTLIHKQQVKTIAEACMLEGGTAVHQARALYKIWTGEEIEENTCEKAIENEENQLGTNNTELRITPNPADATMRLTYKVPADSQTAILEIISYTGRVVATYTLPTKRMGYIIPTDILANGFYFVRLRNNQGFQQSTKLIIQH